MDVLVFPDVRAALFDLVNGSTHFDPATGNTVTAAAVYHLPADDFGALQGPFPLVQIVVLGGTAGFVDRVDRARIDVYAPGEQAVNVLESICSSMCGYGIEMSTAYLDRIDLDVTPAEVPYQSDELNLATATLLVTTRPIN